MNNYSQGEKLRFLGLGCLASLFAIIANLALLAGGVWVVIKILQYMNVI